MKDNTTDALCVVRPCESNDDEVHYMANGNTTKCGINVNDDWFVVTKNHDWEICYKCKTGDDNAKNIT